MTGPLAQQFAQVREESALLADWAEEPLGMESVDVDNVRGRLLEALSSIERHVHDMETALRDVARVSDDALKDGHPGIPDVARLHRIAVAALDDVLAAALPAREKGTE